jgi:hypothetical protein
MVLRHALAVRFPAPQNPSSPRKRGNIDGAAIAVRHDVNGGLLLDRHSGITTNLRNSVNKIGIPAYAGMTEYLIASRLYRNTAS